MRHQQMMKMGECGTIFLRLVEPEFDSKPLKVGTLLGAVDN
jgi:hypothetical protein